MPTFEDTIQRRDLDTNHHVNNANYVDFAYESLPKDVYENYDFKNMEVTYKHELKLNDTIHGFYSKLENGDTIVTIKNKNTGVVNAIMKLY